jgi:hypothetical protein
MIRKAAIIGIAAIGLMLAMKQTRPAYSVCRIVSSAQSFQRNFRTLESAGDSLNPIERFLFSLVLSNTKTAAAPPAGPRHT